MSVDISHFFRGLTVLFISFGDVSAADPSTSLFGPMGRMIEPNENLRENILPLPSLNEVERVSKLTGIPRNILRAYEKQGLDVEIVAASLLAQLGQGRNIEQIMPKPMKELANEIADQIEGIERQKSSFMRFAERLMEAQPEKILSVEYINLNSADFIYITYYREAECLKILDFFEEGLRQGCPNCERKLFDCNTPKTSKIHNVTRAAQLEVPYVTLTGRTYKHFILGGTTRHELNQICEDMVNDIRREGGEAFCVK